VNETFSSYREAFPDLAGELQMVMNGELPPGWETALPQFPADAKGWPPVSRPERF